ncbi:hypothetical protein F2Q69_00044423 [Brassica cretica]|uniref:RNase H type-1 domain-containing protein n=1 Tax=Brassica cretica TaxID=69181 RepID=A0A8S9NIY6_BRACR|nr:hypothetical protein F2Q69_00044423 [Brassica cretica]
MAASSIHLTRITKELDKGKGHVFSYTELLESQQCVWPFFGGASHRELMDKQGTKKSSSVMEEESCRWHHPEVTCLSIYATEHKAGSELKTQGRPIRVCFSLERDNPAKSRFFFDKCMLSRKGFEDMVRLSLDGGTGDHSSTMERIGRCRRNIMRWKKRVVAFFSVSEHAFLNMHYLISCSQKQSIGASVRLSFPWLLWHIWKARNKFCFEQIRPMTLEVVTVAMEESGMWLQLNGHLKEIVEGLQVDPGVGCFWSKPPLSWVKCNIGSSWDSSSLLGGAGWIIRDAYGKALVHSRRSFNGMSSAFQIDLVALAWATAAVVDLKLKNVIFEFSSAEAATVLHNPLLSPFNYKRCYEILRNVQAVVRSKLQLVSVTSNKAASAIALSVTRDLRHHSYVASNGPRWLYPLPLLVTLLFSQLLGFGLRPIGSLVVLHPSYALWNYI